MSEELHLRMHNLGNGARDAHGAADIGRLKLHKNWATSGCALAARVEIKTAG